MTVVSLGINTAISLPVTVINISIISSRDIFEWYLLRCLIVLRRLMLFISRMIIIKARVVVRSFIVKKVNHPMTVTNYLLI